MIKIKLLLGTLLISSVLLFGCATTSTTSTSTTTTTASTTSTSTTTTSSTSTTTTSTSTTTTLAPNLYDINFNTSGVGLAVGADGMVLRTDNSGLSWEVLDIGSSEDFYLVYSNDDGTGTLLGTNGTYLASNDGETGWGEQFNAPDTTETLYFFDVFNDDGIGLIAGSNGTILRSQTLGGTFEAITGVTTFDIFALTSNGGNTILGCGSNGLIIVSTDTGESWTVAESDTINDLYSIIYQPEMNLIFAVGANNTLLASDSFALTWESSNIDLVSSSTDFYTMGGIGNNLYIVGANGTILETADFVTWTTKESGTTSTLRKWVGLEDNEENPTGYFFIGDNMTMLRSTDGTTWYLSNDGGQTWGPPFSW
ncbi:MAG: hypothetical protein ABIE84_03415 [bacterium]